MFAVLAVFCCGFVGAVLAASQYEGFGSRSVGGEGGRVFWVDPELGDVGSNRHGVGTKERPCSLRKALSGGNRTIKFTRGGTITLNAGIFVQDSHITIDGASAPAPGITVTHTQANHGGIIFGCPGKHIHDLIVSHVRFQGLWPNPPKHVAGYTILGAYAEDYEGGKISNLVYDHLTVCNLQDKSTLWGNIENVTVSWCLFHDSHMSSLVSFYNRQPDLRRRGISFHHNVWTRSAQRNPQLRGWIESFDFVNNIVHGWTYYGMRIKNEPDEKSVAANVVNNMFLPTERPDSALIYGWSPGPDYADEGPKEDLPQGAVCNESRMGKLWVSGNVLPAENRDQYSTVAKPLPIPQWARVATRPAELLGEDLVPEVGMKYRNEREDELLAEIASAVAT